VLILFYFILIVLWVNSSELTTAHFARNNKKCGINFSAGPKRSVHQS